ncbi:MAG: hypothetical protein KF735_07220 [Chelatococcus sp.]|uniref:hypothetical protein n=1 Tax=unclassified Chelatococcus TaxID=2638111 RepID=UPI001BCDE5E9|nr:MULTISPECIES: hypothetical protein [unclassified Chelatococcus]CAH1657957.1 hypothetical protein CHELA20_11665 [Hyphomicrobiales bacterium]MBS7742236.1 hypothetical protein [Chelatococcus sp. HY11]MBX3537408.1 hypothetical protein [Chelatococcus sp.]MBX3542646.1 hypothetical protein [Chelatococcus sp.]MCO5075138.1 hypothetical protein [Chelatococcus sp.]
MDEDDIRYWRANAHFNALLANALHAVVVILLQRSAGTPNFPEQFDEIAREVIKGIKNFQPLTPLPVEDEADAAREAIDYLERRFAELRQSLG